MIVAFSFIVNVAISSELLDTIIFTVIVLALEILIYYFLFRKSDKIRIEIYKDIKEKDTDIYDDSILKDE
jgi:hypothetical protein